MRHFLILSTLLLLSSGGSALAGKAMTGKDFQEKIVGQTLNWKHKSNSGTIRFNRSGSIAITFKNNKKLSKDSGKWQWKNGANCTRYKKIRKGKEKCTKIYFDGAGFRGANGSVMHYK